MKSIPMRMLVALLSITVIFGGCAKKDAGPKSMSSGGIDLTTPISELKAAAAEMDLAALEKTAKKYMDQIVAKQTELESLMDKVAAIPIAQKMGDEAKALQGDISELTSAISDLKQRFQVYVDYIKEKGGDIAQFTLPK